MHLLSGEWKPRWLSAGGSRKPGGAWGLTSALATPDRGTLSPSSGIRWPSTGRPRLAKPGPFGLFSLCDLRRRTGAEWQGGVLFFREHMAINRGCQSFGNLPIPLHPPSATSSQEKSKPPAASAPHHHRPSDAGGPRLGNPGLNSSCLQKNAPLSEKAGRSSSSGSIKPTL